MARKSRTSQGPLRRWGSRFVAGISRVFPRPVVWMLIALLGIAGAALAAGRGVDALRNRAEHELMQRRPFPVVEFSDLPPQLTVLAHAELEDSLLSLLDGPWTDDRLCRAMAQKLERVGWVASVRHVRRFNDGRFDVRCSYRIPVAMVQFGDEYFLVDDDGVRLPGIYRADASWQLIEGVASKPPDPGISWNATDIKAALRLLRSMRGEPFMHQVAAIDVSNFMGRSRPSEVHVVLHTTQEDGRILWGSAPGAEIEENSVKQKLTILRENYLRTGRADAGHPVIDISTFPDRFKVPG